jgi:hypothetical protein
VSVFLSSVNLFGLVGFLGFRFDFFVWLLRKLGEKIRSFFFFLLVLLFVCVKKKDFGGE